MLYAAVALAAFNVVPADGVELPISINFTKDKLRQVHFHLRRYYNYLLLFLDDL
jgi:hypothetical protein